MTAPPTHDVIVIGAGINGRALRTFDRGVSASRRNGLRIADFQRIAFPR
jgi:hypothetical protein